MPFGAFRLNSLGRYSAPASTLSYRTDPYASYLILCLPFDTENQFTDVTPSIKGSGSPASSTQGGNSTITTTQKKWSLTYAKSLENVATVSTQSMTYTLPSSLPSSASGTFVIEGWFYANNATTNANWAISSADTNGRFLFGINNGSTFSFASENNIGIGSGWHHIAIVCDAGTKRFYYDAIYKGAWVSTNTGFTTLHLGQFSGSDHNDYRGHIQDFRIYSGTNKGYTGTSTTVANFAVPDSVISIAERTAKTITANGNTQISTAQSKFSGASALFDGNGDYLTAPNSSDLNFTENYTIEFWWYQPTNVAAGIYPTFLATGAVGDNKGWEVTSEPTTNKVSFITSANGSSGMSVLATTASITAAAWHHIAVVRNSSVVSIYVDGTQSGSTTTTTGNSIASTYPLYIGGGVGGLSSGNFSSSSATVVNLNGYMDEIRISNTARYTANFTPSTTAFTNDSNTLLLIHCNGTNAQTTFFDDNIYANTVGTTYFTPPTAAFSSDSNTVALWHLDSALTDSGPSGLTLSTSGGYNTTTKKFGTASGDLSDSTTDFFARATTGHYWIYGGTAATGAREYTIEFWTYNTVFTNNSETDGGGFQLPLTFVTAAAGVGLTTTGKMTQNQYPGPRGNATGVDVGADTAPTSQWVHQAYVIGNDMKWRGYLDGKLQFIQTAIDPSGIYTTATDIQIGRNSSSGTNANLMIDEIRLSNTARYGK